MKSIKTRILTNMILTTLISLLIVGISGIYLNYSSTIQSLEQSMVEIADVSSDRVGMEIEAYLNISIDAGCMPKIASSTVSKEEKKSIIDGLVETHGLQRGNIIGLDGVSIFDGNNYSDREYYKKALTGKTTVSEPLISKITGSLSMMFAAPIWQDGIPNSKVVGVVYFVPNETFLNDIVTNISISQNGAAYIINSNGYTIADNTMDTITTQNIEEESKTDPSLVALAEIHSKMRQGLSGFGLYEINGIRKIMSYAPIINTDGWSIGVTAYKADFMNSTYAGIAITLALLVISITAASLVALKLANGIGKPIKICADRLVKLSEGDLKSDVTKINTKDETGQLSNATYKIATTLRKIIYDISWGLEELSKGDFTVDSKNRDLYVGDFRAMGESTYKIIERLNHTLSKIDNSANSVTLSSEQVSQAAQSLSQNTTEQASSIQQLVATITDISQQVKHNADNAQEASHKANGVENAAIEGSNKMSYMLSAMNDITSSANEISKIIKTIEDIAFQTNILALNAAVEAARASTAGKGFAVVADEVRNLATKSAEASKNTAELIEKTVKAVETGTKIADETARYLTDVVNGVKEVTGNIDAISLASNEQAQSISQVTLGIEQISAAVHTNSATAQQEAAASEELSSQALILKGLINQFKLRDINKSCSLESSIKTNSIEQNDNDNK